MGAFTDELTVDLHRLWHVALDREAAHVVAQLRLVGAHEAALGAAVGYEKLNYLMLMMVDPHVHFHVVPRYEGAREWPKGAKEAREFVDVGWPKVPDLGHAVALEGDDLAALTAWLKAAFEG